MKKNGFLFLMAFALFVLLPVNVFASEEFTKYEIIVDDPVVGEAPSSTAKVVYSNETTTAEYDVNLIWYIVNEDYTYTELNSTEKIKEETRYAFDLTTDDYNNIAEDFADKDYSKSGNLEVYINNYEIYYPSNSPKEDQNYYIGATLETRFYIETPIAGETACETATFIVKTEDKTYEFILKVNWSEIDDDYFETGISTFEVGKKYTFGILLEEESFISGSMEDYETLLEKTDFRTRLFINDKEITSEEELIYGPLEDNVRVTLTLTNITSSNQATEIARGSEYKTTLTAVTDYNLSESIVVKVGGNVLDSTKYTYDLETGVLIIPSEYVTGSIIVEASALSDSSETANSQPEENPNTFDSIINSILIGTLSLIGLVGAIIYFKKINKENL